LAVRLRLTRMGRKNRPYYRIIAVDSRKKRDGDYLDRLGYYHPLDDPPKLMIDAEKTLKWLQDGAQPSETVRSLLRKEGVWFRFRLEKRGLPESQIQTLMAEWFAAHSVKEQPKPEPEHQVAEKTAVAEPAVEPVAEAVVTEPETDSGAIAEESEPAASAEGKTTSEDKSGEEA